MFAFGFALVPFYRVICEVTGMNNILQADEKPLNSQIDFSRKVTVEFDANTHKLPWQFRPMQSSITVRPGELTTVEYEVHNNREQAVAGQAVPSYGPQLAAQYFKKVECFCFRQQTLSAGETRRMPVVFVIDPALPKNIDTITLSYTFFEIPGAMVVAPVRQPG